MNSQSSKTLDRLSRFLGLIMVVVIVLIFIDPAFPFWIFLWFFPLWILPLSYPIRKMNAGKKTVQEYSSLGVSRSTNKSQNTPTGSRKPCPNCGVGVEQYDKQCGVCGHRL